MVQKASTPWSTRTVAEGGTDSPVGDLVPVPNEIKPVVSTGFISNTGKFTGLPADDLSFTFQDPSQALAAGADMEFNVNMLQHGKLIIAILDASGNDINVDLLYRNPTTPTGPYAPFGDVGVNGDFLWKMNALPGGSSSSSLLEPILNDTSESLAATWQFFSVRLQKGTQGRILIHNNEGSNAGTISTAYLRLV